MKTSLSFLPANKQEELQTLVKYILEEAFDTKIIILFGSYATGKYVDYDQREEYGVRTSFQSDYDIVVLTPRKKVMINTILRRLDDANEKYMKGHHFSTRTPAHFLAYSVESFNKGIREGRYFFTDIVKEGIVIYNSGEYEIEPVRELNYSQILKLSQEYYNEYYESAEDFLDGAKYYYSKERYKKASFLLHQALENYLLAIILTDSLYSPKCHSIKELLKESKMFTPDAVLCFPDDTPENKRLINLLEDAYVQSRYNKDFIVTKEDCDEIIRRLERLRILVKDFCLAKIEQHKQKVITS